MKRKQNLGEHELAMLRYVAEHSPLTVGEAAKSYGTAQGLARTTVLTMMERLRVKGYLTRTQVGGVWSYSLRVDHEDLLTSVVGDFVQRSLGGSLSPFVAYLANSGRLSEGEVAELRRMVDNLESEGAEDKR